MTCRTGLPGLSSAPSTVKAPSTSQCERQIDVELQVHCSTAYRDAWQPSCRH